jgi:hypothetical protein
LPKAGTFLHPDPELIARLPDLVIVHKLPDEFTHRLTALHIPFAEVDRGAIQDTSSEILQIGKATATESQAQGRSHRRSTTSMCASGLAMAATGAKRDCVAIACGHDRRYHFSGKPTKGRVDR